MTHAADDGQPSLFDEVKPVRTRARSTDPGTSFAAVPTADRIRESQRRVRALLKKYGPATDEEIATYARAHGWFTSPSGLRTRRAELVEKGIVKDSGGRATLVSGRKSIVWELTEGGKQWRMN